jgi:hypothetical protein
LYGATGRCRRRIGEMPRGPCDVERVERAGRRAGRRRPSRGLGVDTAVTTPRFARAAQEVACAGRSCRPR